MFNSYNLDKLEDLFPGAANDAFENIAAHIFCTILGRSHGVNRKINQKAIEADPIFEQGDCYAFQSKYYSKTTKLIDCKRDIINDIKKVPPSVTKLMFFVNKEFTENPNSDLPPTYIKEIELTAKSKDLKIEWFTKRNIEQTLEMPKFNFIGERYLGPRKITDFYREAISIIDASPEKNDVYGSISLKEGYLIPHINVTGERIPVNDFIEKWILGNEKILIIYGEPGHGKTIFSLKAMYDHFKNGWLFDCVDNVFSFSLNPVFTSILSDTALSITPFLSWGFERQNKLMPKDCNNSLVIFDGYDELADCVSSLDFEYFLRSIKNFQKSTNSHIIITSRKMAISSSLRDGHVFGDVSIPAYELQPLSKEEQLQWLNTYKSHYLSKYNDTSVFSWNAYFNQFSNSLSNANYNELIGIPAVFRMIVASQYIPQANADIIEIYDGLFNYTYDRRLTDYTTSKKCFVRQALQKLALAIYEDNTNTTVVNNSDFSFWLFSFYTTSEGQERVGFYTRSLYQFFLAKEILSWYIEYTFNGNYNDFKKKLYCLSRRRLDETTLDFFKQLFNKKLKENPERNDIHSLNNSLIATYNILKDTDGFLPPITLSDVYSVPSENGLFSPIPANESKTHEKILLSIIPIERANNVFWNLISIGSNCGLPINKSTINIRAVQLYDLKGCILSGAELEGVNLVEAKLSKANLRNARLSGADLSRAHLREAILNNADLSNAYLSEASLKRAKFISTQLRNAKMIGADLRNADFRSADIKNTYFLNAKLSGAQFQATHNRTEANWTGAIMNQDTARYLSYHGVDISVITKSID